MTEECKHVFDYKHPNFMQCTKCDKCVPIFCMKSMSTKEFEKLYPPREIGKIIFNEWN